MLLCLGLSHVPLFGDEGGGMNKNLYQAVYHKDIESTRSLLEAGVNPNGRGNEGHTVSYYANGIEILDLLASYGARFDIVDSEGISPLMEYVQGSHQKIEEANFVFNWEQRHSPGFSAGLGNRKDYLSDVLRRLGFRRSNTEGRVALAESLLDAGADPAARYRPNNVPIVFWARGNDGLVTLLVERGAPLDGFSDDDKTLLMYQADTYAGELVEFLLARGADPNQQNSSGETALMYAHSITAAAVLLAYGADPNLQNNKGETSLIRTWFYPEIQRILLRAGADPTIKDNEGKTAMHYWPYGANMPLLDELLAAGCPLDDPDSDGITPLMNAASSSNEQRSAKTVPALLERGADPNKSRDYRGRSILHVYLWRIDSHAKEAIPVVEALLAAGARPADMDEEGDSALLLLLRESRYYPEMKPLRKMALKYSSAGESITARAKAAKISGEDFRYRLSENSSLLSIVLFAFLIIGGLSVAMREWRFAGDKSKNPMGVINGLLTLNATGLYLGFMIGWGNATGDLGAVFAGVFAAIVGSVVGTIIACLPPTRRAFTNYPVLYYIPTAASAIVVLVVISKIFS